MNALACQQVSYLSKLIEPQVWFPVFSGCLAYLIQLWIRTVVQRRSESRLAVMCLGEIEEEVTKGTELFEFMFLHGGEVRERGGRPLFMTTECWNEGHKSAIPDVVFDRIMNVAHHAKKMDLHGLRSHLKNYYVCICGQYRRIALKEVRFEPMDYRNSLDGARMVKKLVLECKTMMERNSKRVLWPW